MTSSDDTGSPEIVASVNGFQRYNEVMSQLVRLEFDASLGEEDDSLIEDLQEQVKHTLTGEEVLAKKSVLRFLEFNEVLEGSSLTGTTITDINIRLTENAKVFISRIHPMRDYVLAARFLNHIGNSVFLQLNHNLAEDGKLVARLSEGCWRCHRDFENSLVRTNIVFICIHC